MWDHFLQAYEDWWSLTTCVLAVVFVLYYGLTSPWWKTPFGFVLIAVDLGLAIATLPTALLFAAGINLYNYLWFTWAVIVIGLLIPGAIAYRLVTLINVRHSKFWKKVRRERP